MILKATLRFFYGKNENRILYIYTIELNSSTFVFAFQEITNIVNFLQMAECDILDIQLVECLKDSDIK